MGPVEDLLSEPFLIRYDNPVPLFIKGFISPMLQHEHTALVDLQGLELLIESVVVFWTPRQLLLGGWTALDPFLYFH